MGTETPLQSATWRMNPVEPNLLDSTRFIPGIYALQNKASKTFLSLSPDETTIGCWPKADLKKGIPKVVIMLLVDVLPLMLATTVGNSAFWRWLHDQDVRHQKILYLKEWHV